MTEDFRLKQLPDSAGFSFLRELYPEIDQESVEIVLRYQAVSKELTKAYHAFFSQYDLTDAKFSVLMILFRAPDKTLLPSEIAEQFGISRASVTTLTDGLVSRKLITREPDQADRRKMIISLTAQGEACLKEILPIHYKLTRDLTVHFSEKQKTDFLRSISDLEAGVERYKQEYLKEANNGRNNR